MPLSTTSTASEGADSIPGVPGKVYRVGYDKDGSLPPLVIEDTEDESDYDPTGLLTPVSINLGHERALQREQERYRREQQDLQSQHAWLQRLQAAWAADSAKGGWHMRTRAGIVRNESDLCGWDELFCHLNDQGKLEATESVRDHIMVSAPCAGGGGSIITNIAASNLSQIRLRLRLWLFRRGRANRRQQRPAVLRRPTPQRAENVEGADPEVLASEKAVPKKQGPTAPGCREPRRRHMTA